MNSNIHISIVSTLYKSEKFLRSFIEQVLDAMKEIECDSFEIILVNDGSPDASSMLVLELQNSHPQLVLVDLSRNFGHHAAQKAGLELAKGEYIYLTDCDLEVSPELIPRFYSEITAPDQPDMVYGVQDRRRGSFVNRITGKIFWSLLKRISEVEIPENMLTERMFRDKFLKELLKMGDYNLFLGGMFHWLGFNNRGIEIQKQHRSGPSTYSTGKRIRLMINALSSFSGKPLEWLFYTGLGISALSFLAALVIVCIKLIMGDGIQLGWSSLVVLIIFGIGVISTFQGIIGIYLHKIFKQVQGRPAYIISKIHRK